MRPFIALLCFVVLVGCSTPPATLATTPLPQPTIPAVAEALERPPKGTFEVIGYLTTTADGALLVGGLDWRVGDTPTPQMDAGLIWLPDAPALPLPSSPDPNAIPGYSVVRATGTLSPVGSYGPNGIYPYQLTAVSLEPLGVRDLTIDMLMNNRGIYDNQPVHLSGQILLNASTALLIDQINRGGVPASHAQQIKLFGSIDVEQLHDSLTLTANGSAHFGPVQIIGIWRRSGLYPLVIIPE